MSVRDLLLPSLLALALGAGTAGLVACGDDGDRDSLLRSSDAERLLGDLGDARDALAGGRCSQARRAADDVASAAEGLPRAVDDRLARRIRRGAEALQEQIGPDCEEQIRQETVPTTTATTPTEPETTPETTPDTNPETTPDTNPETTPPETTPEEPVPPADTAPDGTGGVTPSPFDDEGE